MVCFRRRNTDCGWVAVWAAVWVAARVVVVGGGRLSVAAVCGGGAGVGGLGGGGGGRGGVWCAPRVLVIEQWHTK